MSWADIPTRRLGRTNEQVSIVGLGGYHIGKPDVPDSVAVKLIHSAIDRGITFMDNCWDYNNGSSELRMGRALSIGGYRDRVFLMTKIDGRSAKAFDEQFEQSLHRLLVDHVDLVQFHENIHADDAERIFEPGGAYEAALAAQRAGKTRFIGFTGHKSPKLHVHMIDVAAAHGVTFDTVQMPLNVMDAHHDSFERTVVPLANRLDMGVIGMKTFGDHFILDAQLADPIEMLHYGMTVSPGTLVTGIDSFDVLDQAVKAASTFRPLSPGAIATLLAKTAATAINGKTELYKSTRYFDGTVQNPAWLG